MPWVYFNQLVLQQAFTVVALRSNYLCSVLSPLIFYTIMNLPGPLAGNVLIAYYILRDRFAAFGRKYFDGPLCGLRPRVLCWAVLRPSALYG